MGNLGGKEERGRIMNIGKPGTVGIKWENREFRKCMGNTSDVWKVGKIVKWK